MDTPMMSNDDAAASSAGLAERAGKSNSRKSHRKTRTGCKTCKQRKIKCDEARPQCNNCIRHSVRCDFLSHDSPYERSPVPAAQGHVETPPLTGTSNNGFSSNYEAYVPEPSQGLDPPGGAYPHCDLTSETSESRNSDHVFVQYNLNILTRVLGLNLWDLELLHNYTTHTAATLHTDPIVKVLFQTTIPQLGFQHEFVMRGALAISALHLARFKPEKRDFYMSQAVRHQEIGLRTATSIIPSITEENRSAVYIFSMMAFFFALASPRKPGDFLMVGDNGVADWLFLIKGTRYIMESSPGRLDEGPIAPLFRVGSRRNKLREMYAAEMTSRDDPLTALRELIHSRPMDPNHLQIYDEALDGLRKSYVMVYDHSLACETGDVFVWLFQASDGYVHLLRQHTPESLVILAYFCTLMKRLEHHWWIEGWGTHLISKIFYILNEEHRLWIQWPIEDIGWIPN